MVDELEVQETQEAVVDPVVEAPQTVTPEQVAALTAKIEELESKLATSEDEGGYTFDPTDQNAVDALYQEQFGKTDDTGATEELTPWQRSVNAQLEQMAKVTLSHKAADEHAQKATQRDTLNTEMRAKYADWQDLEPVIWGKIAREHGTVSADQAYVLAKLEKGGLESLTAKEVKVVEKAEKVSVEAGRAVSEKPGGGGTGATRDFKSLAEAAEAAYDALPVKPQAE